jgi:hypothetical protein
MRLGTPAMRLAMVDPLGGIGYFAVGMVWGVYFVRVGVGVVSMNEARVGLWLRRARVSWVGESGEVLVNCEYLG